MARVANRDTFMYERVGIQPGDDTEVRRQVIAGQPIPDHYLVGEDTDEGALEEVEGAPVVGLGAAPQAYKHQLDDRGQLKEEHRGRGGQEEQERLSRESEQKVASSARRQRRSNSDPEDGGEG